MNRHIPKIALLVGALAACGQSSSTSSGSSPAASMSIGGAVSPWAMA